MISEYHQDPYSTILLIEEFWKFDELEWRHFCLPFPFEAFISSHYAHYESVAYFTLSRASTRLSFSPEVASVNTTLRAFCEITTRRGWCFLLNRD